MPGSLNHVQLIGNLTRDPELRYTSKGKPFCTFGLATSRSWIAESGEKKEEPEYHRIVVWNQLAETCSDYLTKGTKVYVRGRIAYRTYEAQDGTQKSITEVVIDNMIILSPKKMDDTPELADTPEGDIPVLPDEIPF